MVESIIKSNVESIIGHCIIWLNFSVFSIILYNNVYNMNVPY